MSTEDRIQETQSFPFSSELIQKYNSAMDLTYLVMRLILLPNLHKFASVNDNANIRFNSLTKIKSKCKIQHLPRSVLLVMISLGSIFQFILAISASSLYLRKTKNPMTMTQSKMTASTTEMTSPTESFSFSMQDSPRKPQAGKSRGGQKPSRHSLSPVGICKQAVLSCLASTQARC